MPNTGKTIRLRDKDHLKFVSKQPCVVCGREPSDAHHLRFAQPRALGRKVSDEFTVPVCRLHHRELHRHGDETAWWTVSISILRRLRLRFGKAHTVMERLVSRQANARRVQSRRVAPEVGTVLLYLILEMRTGVD